MVYTCGGNFYVTKKMQLATHASEITTTLIISKCQKPEMCRDVPRCAEMCRDVPRLRKLDFGSELKKTKKL